MGGTGRHGDPSPSRPAGCGIAFEPSSGLAPRLHAVPVTCQSRAVPDLSRITPGRAPRAGHRAAASSTLGGHAGQVLNGVNLNMLGRRDPALYGDMTLAAGDADLRVGAGAGHDGPLLPDQYEGEYVEMIHGACRRRPRRQSRRMEALQLRDARCPRDLHGPVIEVHLSDIERREEFRRYTVIAELVARRICGQGAEGYREALSHWRRTRHDIARASSGWRRACSTSRSTPSWSRTHQRPLPDRVRRQTAWWWPRRAATFSDRLPLSPGRAARAFIGVRRRHRPRFVAPAGRAGTRRRPSASSRCTCRRRSRLRRRRPATSSWWVRPTWSRRSDDQGRRRAGGDPARGRPHRAGLRGAGRRGLEWRSEYDVAWRVRELFRARRRRIAFDTIVASALPARCRMPLLDARRSPRAAWSPSISAACLTATPPIARVPSPWASPMPTCARSTPCA